MSERRFTVLLIGGIISLVLAIMLPIWAGSYYAGRAACSNWGKQANRQTEFRVLVQPLGVPASWDCFTPVGSDRWLPIDRVREFDE